MVTLHPPQVLGSCPLIYGAESDVQSTPSPSPSKKPKIVQQVGIQKTPQQFFSDARNVQHPMSPQKLLPEVMKKAIMDNLTKDPLTLAKERMHNIFKIRKMAEELDQAEVEMKQQLDPDIARVLSSKRILLWEKLLQLSQYQDLGIVELVKQGIPLHGEHDYPNFFPYDWKPATSSSRELLDGALWRRRALQSNSAADCRR